MVKTTKQAANELNCNPVTVVRACHRAGIEMVAGRFLLSDRQIRGLKKIIREKSGNPNFVRKQDLEPKQNKKGK